MCRLGPRKTREKAEAIRNDAVYLRKVMEQGAEKARVSAQKTIGLAKEAIGGEVLGHCMSVCIQYNVVLVEGSKLER